MKKTNWSSTLIIYLGYNLKYMIEKIEGFEKVETISEMKKAIELLVAKVNEIVDIAVVASDEEE